MPWRSASRWCAVRPAGRTRCTTPVRSKGAGIRISQGSLRPLFVERPQVFDHEIAREIAAAEAERQRQSETDGGDRGEPEGDDELRREAELLEREQHGESGQDDGDDLPADAPGAHAGA